MTMIWIAGQTLASDGTIQFNNLPTNFTHLQLRVSAVAPSSSATGVYSVSFGLGDSGGFWSSAGSYAHSLYGDGSSVISSSQSGGNNAGFVYGVNGGTNIRTIYILDLLDYANTNKNKTFRILNGYDANGSGRVGLISGFYANLGVPTFLTFNFGGTQAGAGTRADLYGITTSALTGA